MPITGGAVRWQQQTDAILNQAAPVQNTWYTALETTRYTHIKLVVCSVAATAEDLEIEVTVDGVTYAGSKAGAVAGTTYAAGWAVASGAAGVLSLYTVAVDSLLDLEGNDVRMRVRKTTAAGAGTLNCKVIYALER